MEWRTGSWTLVGAVIVAGVFAAFRSQRVSPSFHEAASSESVGHADEPLGLREQGEPSDPPSFGPSEDLPPDHPPVGKAQGDLPPNHPPIGNAQGDLPPSHPPIGNAQGGASATHHAFESVGRPSANGAPLEPNDDSPAITWRAPKAWRTMPNASAMRLATYRVPARTAADEGELTVVRAGGSTDANIQRWLGQFDDAGMDKRTEKSVHGLKVTVVEVTGTFEGGGMMTANSPPPRHPGWALLGAIVETPGAPYFFKLLGPVATVRSARADFDALIAGIVPSSGGSKL